MAAELVEGLPAEERLQEVDTHICIDSLVGTADSMGVVDSSPLAAEDSQMVVVPDLVLDRFGL